MNADPSGYRYPLSYQLRDDALSVMSFKVLLGIRWAHLTVVEPPEPEPTSSSQEETGPDHTNSNQLPQQQPAEEDSSQQEKSIPKITLFTFTTTETGDNALTIIDLSKEINDQVCHSG